MNLKVYTAVTINRRNYNGSIMVNTAYLTNISSESTNTNFLLQYHNFEKQILVSTEYDNVVADAQNYSFGTKIEVPIVAIGNNNVNETVLINVDLLLYGYTNNGLTELVVADRSDFSIYKTYDSLAALEIRAAVNSGRGEIHVMAAGQTTITSTNLNFASTQKLYKNGVLQGFISGLSNWTVNSVSSITYSGASFFGGEEIFIIP